MLRHAICEQFTDQSLQLLRKLAVVGWLPCRWRFHSLILRAAVEVPWIEQLLLIQHVLELLDPGFPLPFFELLASFRLELVADSFALRNLPQVLEHDVHVFLVALLDPSLLKQMEKLADFFEHPGLELFVKTYLVCFGSVAQSW